jgi:NAD(P)-dependent dehydrogenase (short-subunit alcohol dehydrogenase family)
MTDSHHRRSALVTGAARGIGAAIAARLHKDGWHVLLVDIDAEAVARYAAELGGSAHAMAADVGDEADAHAAVERARDRFGRLDALVCNAGFMIRKPIAELTLTEWSGVLATNLTSTFLLVRAAETLLRQAQGSVITIASTRAHMSEPDTESYAASKGGLVALTHALAISLGPSIRVNCISPGWIDTKNASLRQEDHAQHPAGRVGRPADVAAMAAWLLDAAQGFVTGAEFVIDGGMSRKMIYID